MKMAEFREMNGNQLDEIEKVATEIWKQHYSSILSDKQIEFMLKKFQSAKAISEQMKNGYHYVGLCDETGLAGYYAIQLQEEFLFLSKIYFCNRLRGKGYFKKALEHMSKYNTENKPIMLTVNRFNPSVEVYQKAGFKVVSEEKNPIGNGYFMDDFIMVK